MSVDIRGKWFLFFGTDFNQSGEVLLNANKGRFTYCMPFPYRAHAVPLPCRAAKGLECVFPI